MNPTTDKRAHCVEIQRNGNKCFRWGHGVTDVEWVHASDEIKLGDVGTLRYISGSSYGGWIFIRYEDNRVAYEEAIG